MLLRVRGKKGACVRAAPDLNSDCLGHLPKGSEVVVLESTFDKVVRIRIEAGWVSARCLSGEWHKDRRGLEVIIWIFRKLSVGQHCALVGEDRRRLRSLALKATRGHQDAEFVTVSAETCGTDLTQRLDFVDGKICRLDGPAVRAAKRGATLILDGIDRAEHNVLPVLNELLENRRIPLDDGTNILHAQPDFATIALTKELSLDPPLRSRFAAKVVLPPHPDDLAQAAAALGLPDLSRALPTLHIVREIGAVADMGASWTRAYRRRMENSPSFSSTNIHDVETYSFADGHNDDKNLVPSRRDAVRDLFVDHSVGTRGLCVFGPRGSGKSLVARSLARRIDDGSNNPLIVWCHGDMCARDMLQRRFSSRWIDSGIVKACKEGRVVICENIHSLPDGVFEAALETLLNDGFVSLPDGEKLRVPGNFRLVATSETPSFSCSNVELTELSASEQQQILRNRRALDFLKEARLESSPRTLISFGRALRRFESLKCAAENCFGVLARWGGSEAEPLRKALSNAREESAVEEANEDPGFVATPGQARAFAALTRSHHRVLIVGPQGVGKNLVVEKFLRGRKSEYAQLHRDSTVSSLLVSLAPNLSEWIESPLVRASRNGSVCVVDEADKAPPEVVAVLRAILDAPTEVQLPDNTILTNFPIIVLANRPGFPFHGNDFFKSCGDVFEDVIILDAPDDPDHEVRLFRSLAPSTDPDLADRIVRALVDLRKLADKGHLTYPYSTRDLCRIARHLEVFGTLQEGIEDVTALDPPKEKHLVQLVLKKHRLSDDGDHERSSPSLENNAGTPTSPAQRLADGEESVDSNDCGSSSSEEGEEEVGEIGGETSREVVPTGGVDGEEDDEETASVGGGGQYHEVKETMSSEEGNNEETTTVCGACPFQEVEETMSNEEVVLESLVEKSTTLRTLRDERRVGTERSDDYDTLVCEGDKELVKAAIRKRRLAGLERTWAKRQAHGELDEARLVDAVLGDGRVYQRRFAKQDASSRLVLKVVLDASASTYDADEKDGRLRRILRIAATLCDVGGVNIALTGFSGSGPEIAFKRLADGGAPPRRCTLIRRIATHAQYCRRGDTTIPAVRIALDKMARANDDDQKNDCVVLLVLALDQGDEDDKLRELADTLKTSSVPVAVILVADGEAEDSTNLEKQQRRRAHKFLPGAIIATDDEEIGPALESALLVGARI